MSKNSKLSEIVKYIEKTAKRYNVAPHDVTSAQFWSVTGQRISEWEIRKLGGFTNIRDLNFERPESAYSNLIPRESTSKKFKPITRRLENFTVYEADIKQLFKQAKLKPDDVLRVVVQPDTHVPEHDPVAVNAFCKFLSFYKPHGLINLGDFLEMSPVSHWGATDAKPRRLVEDIKKAKKVLQQIDEAAGPQCNFKRFLIGNHEDWLSQYLVEKIPEVLDGLEEIGPSLRIQDLLGLKDFGYRSIPLNEILRVGEAHYIHGFYCSTHHAKKHLDVFGCNIYYGHLHDVQSHSAVSIKAVHEAMSLGCLRSLQAPFLKGKPNNWAHSFGIFEFRSDGSYTRYAPIMINGSFSFGGKIFDGKK